MIRGRYKHFKGNEYEVIDVATHTETNEKFVVYKSVDSAKVWIRPYAMFFEIVDKPEYNYSGPRFIKIS